MTIPSASEQSGEAALPPDLLTTLLCISQSGIMIMRPFYDARGEEIVDLAWVYLNPAAQQMLRLPERPAESFLELYPTAKAAGVFGFYRDAYLSGEVERRQNNYQHDQLNGYYLLVAQRHGELLVVSFTDTNDHPRTAIEEELRQSQAREIEARAEAEAQRAELQRIFEQAPVAVAVYRGPQFAVEFANAATLAIWGRSLEQVLHRPVFEVLPEAASGEVLALFNDTLASEQPRQVHEQLTLIERNGRSDTVYWNFIFQPQRDAEGHITGLISVGTEVTEQVLARQQVQSLNAELAATNQELRANYNELQQAQQQLQQLNAELEARVVSRTQALQSAQAEAERRRQRLEQLFMQAPAGICIHRGPDLVYELVNPRYQQLLPGRVLLGKPLLEALPELVGHEAYRSYCEVYRTGQVHEEQALLVPLARPDDGVIEDRYFNFVQQPRYNEHGQVDGVVVFAFEVTEQVLAGQQVLQLNEELAASNTQLTHTNTDLDTFVYTASHDLKAPIANIEGLLHALRAHLSDAELSEAETTQLLDLMHDSIARFQETLGHLTDISKLQLTQVEPAEVVELHSFIAALQLDLLPLLTVTGGQLTVAMEDDPAVRFSPKNLRSILYNLLSNALKYAHPGRLPRVQLRCTRTANGVVLEVQDNGLGLTKQQQGELFVLFRRLHTHVEGTGVGLYMVKRLVENGGGTVEVQSQLGVGSTFRVTLPA